MSKIHTLECPMCGGKVEVEEKDASEAGLALSITKRECDPDRGEHQIAARYDHNTLNVILLDEFDLLVEGLDEFGNLLEQMNKMHLHKVGEGLLTMICEAQHNNWDGCTREQLIHYNDFCRDLLTWMKSSEDDYPESYTQRLREPNYGWTCGGSNGYDVMGIRHTGRWDTSDRRVDPPLKDYEVAALKRTLESYN